MSWKTYTVKEPTELTVSKYVKERFSLSSRDIQMMFRKKRVKVNSRVAHSQRSLKKGDVLTLELPQDKDYGVDVEKGDITILYEDAHTLVVNKPPFMLDHPKRSGIVPFGLGESINYKLLLKNPFYSDIIGCDRP